MKTMPRLLPALTLLFLAGLLFAGNASAQTFDEALASLRRGDYDLALPAFTRLAAENDPRAQT
jgi:hypothetical protein